jgi:hypothetical protein
MPTSAVWSIVVGLAIVAIVVGGVYIVSRLTRDPQIKGPALNGTGRVLSITQLQRARGTTSQTARAAGAVMCYGCRIALSVQIPGRAPYEVTIVQYLDMTQIPAVQPGNTLAVKVDSTNPQVVLIDFDSSEPVTNQAAGFGSPQTLAQMAASGSPPTVAEMAEAFTQNPGAVGAVPHSSIADLLASGQRVRGVLKSFADTGMTPRRLGQTPSRPEWIDAPLYVLDVELQFPNLTPIDARNTQLVPPARVPNLTIGLPLTCAVDPANPSVRFVVDWDAIAH